MNYEAFFKLSYGLYIVSTGGKDNKNGYVANTAFQVTAEPPQMAISCSKDNLSSKMISDTRVFSISVLKQDCDPDLIGLFGYQTGNDTDKFKSIETIFGKNTNVPIVLSDTIAWFECKVVKEIDVGSHIIFIGEILDNELISPDEEPLTYAYYRDVKKGLAPKNAPTYIDKTKLESHPEKNGDEAQKHKCIICGYKYNPQEGDEKAGIPPGTRFEDLPHDWVCPVCSANKDMFE